MVKNIFNETCGEYDSENVLDFTVNIPHAGVEMVKILNSLLVLFSFKSFDGRKKNV